MTQLQHSFVAFVFAAVLLSVLMSEGKSALLSQFPRVNACIRCLLPKLRLTDTFHCYPSQVSLS